MLKLKFMSSRIKYKLILGDNIDFSKITNENCSIIREIPISVTELQIVTRNINKNNSECIPAVKIELGKNFVFLIH